MTIDASLIAREIDRRADQWTAESLHRAFILHGCAVVRDVIPLDRLSKIRDLINVVYETTSDLHVYDRDLEQFTEGRITGFELADVPLLQDLLRLVFRGQNWKRDSVSARRIQGVKANQNWQQPLELHLDSQFHGFQFTVNFWVPFQDCGEHSPGLQLVPTSYRDARRHSGFTGEKFRDDEWFRGYFHEEALSPKAVEAVYGPNCFLRPIMHPGDVIVSSNWIIHGTYRIPEMDQGRTSAEIRFKGELQDVVAPKSRIGSLLRRALTVGA